MLGSTFFAGFKRLGAGIPWRNYLTVLLFAFFEKRQLVKNSDLSVVNKHPWKVICGKYQFKVDCVNVATKCHIYPKFKKKKKIDYLVMGLEVA